jgi:hypothetical protein
MSDCHASRSTFFALHTMHDTRQTELQWCLNMSKELQEVNADPQTLCQQQRIEPPLLQVRDSGNSLWAWMNVVAADKEQFEHSIRARCTSASCCAACDCDGCLHTFAKSALDTQTHFSLTPDGCNSEYILPLNMLSCRHACNVDNR